MSHLILNISNHQPHPSLLEFTRKPPRLEQFSKQILREKHTVRDRSKRIEFRHSFDGVVDRLGRESTEPSEFFGSSERVVGRDVEEGQERVELRLDVGDAFRVGRDRVRVHDHS